MRSNGQIMWPVEQGMGETAQILGIAVERYRVFIRMRCWEYNASDNQRENGGLEGYCEPEEIDEFHRISSLIEERDLLWRVNQDVEFRTTYNDMTQRVYPTCPLRE